MAWPTVLQNAIGGLQGIIDHAMVGPLRRLHRQRRHRRQLADLPRRHRLHRVAVHRHGRARRALRRRERAGQGQSHRLPGVPDRGRARARRPGAARLLRCRPTCSNSSTPRRRSSAEALPFLRTMFVFSIGMLLFFMLGGALRAAGDARTPLRLGIWMTVLNIAFNVVLIPGTARSRRSARAAPRSGPSSASLIVSASALWLMLQRPARRPLPAVDVVDGPTGPSSARCSGSACRPACRAWR